MRLIPSLISATLKLIATQSAGRRDAGIGCWLTVRAPEALFIRQRRFDKRIPASPAQA